MRDEVQMGESMEDFLAEEADPGTCRGDPEFHVPWKSRTQQIRNSTKMERLFSLRIFMD
jgi:hypothetical protein